MSGLDWGRRFLVCNPAHFGVLYEINPWMHKTVQVDVERAQAQWDNLITMFKDAGAELEFQDPVEGWPDMVFTANTGIVNGNQFVPARFRHIERQGESRYDINWFESHGYQVERLPETVVQEGAGDALPFGASDRRVLVAGHRTRSDAASHAFLGASTGAVIASVELVDDRLYHLDLCFTPIDSERALVAPMAFNRLGVDLLTRLVPEPFMLEDEEALSFCCNSVVIGQNIVMPNCPPRVGRQLEAWGFNVMVCDVSEFMKGGGGCRCLSLALDVSVGLG